MPTTCVLLFTTPRQSAKHSKAAAWATDAAPCCAVPCCAALQWWQVDVGYYLICMLGWLGLAWDIKVPSPADKARKRKQTVVVKAD